MLEELWVAVVGNGIFVALAALLRRIERLLEKRNPRRQPAWFYGAWATWFVVNCAAYVLAEVHGRPASIWVLPTLLPTSLLLLYVNWHVVNSYWSVGVRSADQRIDKGLDYKQSLSLVQNELSFLGTGASKLTELTQEFESALRRCPPENPIRFLLMKPSDDNLTNAARRANRDRDAYKEQVLESLRRIARVRNKLGLSNIEVRFYPESQLGWGISSVFRLMFVDASLCLMSYNVFGVSTGPHPGSELPQLHLTRLGAGGTQSGSFYYAVQRFYDLLWEKADKWNFVDFLDG